MKDYMIIFYEKDNYTLPELKRIQSYFGLGLDLALHIGKDEITLLSKRGLNKGKKPFDTIEDAIRVYENWMGTSPKILLCHMSRRKEIPKNISLDAKIYDLILERNEILFGDQESKECKKAVDFLRS